MVRPTIEQITGHSTSHLQEVFPGHFLHRNVVEAYRQLIRQAAEQGIALRLASGFRSFERQLAIWNAKANGERPVLDNAGEVVAIHTMSERDQVFAILRWSALPGASRHHWGTDLDVWDSAKVGDDYPLQLTLREYATGGPFYRCSCWLDTVMKKTGSEFFRPYGERESGDIELAGGVAEEPWHLSFRPLADVFEKALSQDVIRLVIKNTEIGLKGAILGNLDEIYSRFVCSRP